MYIKEYKKGKYKKIEKFLTVYIVLHSIMLIDISDILHICVYELGRTYLRFIQALDVNLVFAGKQLAYNYTG